MDENTPLLQSPEDLEVSEQSKSHWDALREATKSGIAFRRSRVRRGSSSAASLPPAGALRGDRRVSVRALDLPNIQDLIVEPLDALAPLVAGGVIVATDGYKTEPRSPSTVKSLPAFAPFSRRARHRSFYLWWINEFRHWWKSSRLLVRLAGLYTLAESLEFRDKMVSVVPYVNPKHQHKLVEKNAHRAVKIVKQLGQGGPMAMFLNNVQFFTRFIRILVASWRWIESAQCRRREVGVEEAMAFIGNRVSRMLARTAVDLFVLWVIMPAVGLVFKNLLTLDSWHPITLFVIMGIIRACAPYAASFQGSRVGRVLTRQFYQSAKLRWQPIQRVQSLNLTSDDCCEKDEVSQTADLARLAKIVATALGKSQEIGVDGLKGQREALALEGFRQVGAGSGGYAVYECHRRVWTANTGAQGESMMILLHITPYGPSILDVMPRYIVLEFEASVDRRAKWSEFIDEQILEGPPAIEGYCYEGAFFSPHHYAELKAKYDEELLMYDMACKSMCLPRTGRSPNPPTDLLTLKALLAEGKPGFARRKNKREGRELQKAMAKVTKQLKDMMSGHGENCCAPRGVILYFEGLDCSGKSSTGGLVEQALRDAGYNVDMRQYNRPPTEAQKARPWMDRFEIPETTGTVAIAIKNGDGVDENPQDLLDKFCYSALVWDRGPAGDFVYGALAKAPLEEKKERYRDFMAFDKEMFEKKILFCKLLFVTNRDSIASTLGKRLAQKRMARDLRTWLKASRGGDNDTYGDIGFEGLDQIDLHIDPTDFVAFNNYQRNLRIFTNVALNTDSDANPWLVINTANRYAARKQLLSAFSIQLNRFKTRKMTCSPCCVPKLSPATGSKDDTPGIDEATMLERGFTKPWPIKLVLALAGMLLLIGYYCEHTNFDTLVYLIIGEPMFPTNSTKDEDL